MDHRMFSFNKSAKLNSAKNPDIIKKLILIRISGYNLEDIYKEIKEQDYEPLITLVKELGGEILKVNLIHSQGTNQFLTARARFNELINTSVLASKFSLVCYATQLLQFYTLLCDTQFSPNSSIKSFCQFLEEKRHQLGGTDTNLFILEYKIILIYNELSFYLDSYNNSEEPINNNLEQLDVFKCISQQLIRLKEYLDHSIIESPNHIFLRYLHFISQYTFAKLIEFKFTMQNEVSEEGMLELTHRQLIHLNLAKEALEKIEELTLYFQQIGINFVSGVEFSFGQNVLSKFPETQIDRIKKHLISLISINTKPINEL